MSENGKGSKRRPKDVDQKTWDDNYNRIFRQKAPKNVNRDKGSNRDKR
jgi:hypothetical protein